MKYQAGTLASLAIAAVAAGCGETNTAPRGTGTEAANSSVKFWESGATASWNELATSLAARRMVNTNRLYVYLSLAQLRATEAATAIHPHPPTSVAIGGGSAAVLNSFFPDDIAEIEAALDAQEAAEAWPGAKHADFAAGEALGRAIGASVLTFAGGDQVGLADPGPPPIGPGYWIPNGPTARGNYRARPFFLASDSEFRPAPPPAFGSPAYVAALAEVRSISDTRTAEQIAIAVYWHANQSPFSNAALQNLAVELIRSHHVKDADAAKLMFLMNSASFDALIGCFDAKFAYWFIRPSQADPGITLPISLPNHPSYPSAHSCISGAITGVLTAAFPSEADRLAEVAEEASLSRLYAGIHYRFDIEAGLALGRAAAAKALAADLDQVATLP